MGWERVLVMVGLRWWGMGLETVQGRRQDSRACGGAQDSMGEMVQGGGQCG